MIQNFRHRGLQRLYERNDRSRINPTIVDKVEVVLGVLGAADGPQALNLPGYRLHQLGCNLRGFWSISVSGSWQLICRFASGDVYDVDVIDYR